MEVIEGQSHHPNSSLGFPPARESPWPCEGRIWEMKKDGRSPVQLGRIAGARWVGDETQRYVFPSAIGREFIIRQARVWVVAIAVDWAVNSSTSDRIQFLPSGTSDRADCPRWYSSDDVTTK